MNKTAKLLCFWFCLCAVSCGHPVQKASEPDFTDSVAEALENGGIINLDQLQWTRDPAAWEIKEGITENDEVVVKYSGYLEEGTIVNSTPAQSQ